MRIAQSSNKSTSWRWAGLPTYLVVDDSHVKVAQLLQCIGQVCMGFCHVRIQQDASVIESYALLVVAQLVVDGTNQEQNISLVWIDHIYLRCVHQEMQNLMHRSRYHECQHEADEVWQKASVHLQSF